MIEILADVVLSPNDLVPGENLTRQVHALLRRLILELRFPPNRTISDKEVAAKLGISKTPVREALIRLEEEGLIRVVPKSRTYVTPIDLQRYHEGFVVRNALERLAVREAARHRSFEHVCWLEANLAKQRAAINSQEFWEFYTLDERFHALIFQAAGIPGVWDIVNVAKVEIDRVRSLKVVFGIRRIEGVISEHDAIVRAIRERDPEAAEAMMGEHIGSIENKISQLTEDVEFWNYFERVNTGNAAARKTAEETGNTPAVQE